MTSQTSLSWALRPDPELGTRIVAIWTVDGGTGSTEALEIDLMGQARRFRDQVKSEWIAIPDDAPDITPDRSESDALSRVGIYALLDAVNKVAG
jgi:hypothetical protein